MCKNVPKIISIRIPAGKEIPAGPEKNNPYCVTRDAKYKMLAPNKPKMMIFLSRSTMRSHFTKDRIVIRVRTKVPNVQKITIAAVFPE